MRESACTRKMVEDARGCQRRECVQERWLPAVCVCVFECMNKWSAFVSACYLYSQLMFISNAYIHNPLFGLSTKHVVIM